MNCEWCGQRQIPTVGLCELCNTDLESRPAVVVRADPPVATSGGPKDVKTGVLKFGWGPLVGLGAVLTLVALGLYWAFSPDIGANETDEQTEASIAVLPAGSTDCGEGIVVSGQWDCAFGVALAEAFNNVSADLKVPGANVTVPEVFDEVTQASYSLVCRMDEPVECLWSEEDKIFITIL